MVAGASADDFLRLSKKLKAAGRGDLRKELNKSLKAPAKRIIPATRKVAKAKLPKRGGLAARVAKAPQRVQVRTGASTAGVRVVVGGRGGAPRTLDQQGTVRHPVFGNEGKWVEQRVPSARGWFSDTADHLARTDVRDDVVKALDDFARTLKP